jgi:dTDP-4-dehydrorhamnose reductase
MKVLVTGVGGQLGHDVTNWHPADMRESVRTSKKHTAEFRMVQQ